MSEENLWYGTLAATVRVDDLPASRRVVAIELPDDGQWRVCGYGVSDGSGIAQLGITGLPTSRIYAIAIDEWGKPFAPGMPVAYGDVIRPTQFLGWMYQVTSPGVLPGTEPEWWNSMAGVPQPVGTAMMQAVRHYQPVAHGPVSDIEWVEQEFDPHWDSVLALLRFDDPLAIGKDETARTWNVIGAGISSDSVNAVHGSSLHFPSQGSRYLRSEQSGGISFGVLDFTIEFWMLNGRTSSYNGGVLDFRLSGTGAQPRPAIIIESGSLMYVASGLVRLTCPVPVGWAHVAVCRAGNIHRLFVNGSFQWEWTASIDYLQGPITVGHVGDSLSTSDWSFVGNLDELRITKGVARYTENFDPPTAPFPNVGPPL